MMLYSIGKDSARCCTRPRLLTHPALPALHVDTTWKFRAMYDLTRPHAMREWSCCPQEPRGRGAGDQSVRLHGGRHTSYGRDGRFEAGARPGYGFDAVFGRRRGATRRRAAPRSACVQLSAPPRTAGIQEPALWHSTMPARTRARASASSALQLDRTRHLAIYPRRGDRDRAALFAGAAPDGGARRLILMVDDARFRLRDGESRSCARSASARSAAIR